MSYISTTELDCESPTDTDQHSRCTTSRSFDVTTPDYSVDQSSIRRGVMEDDSMSGPAPKTGMVVCRGTPLIKTGSYNKGSELLKPPNLTTPQGYTAWSPPGGGIELKGRVSLHWCQEVWDCSDLIKLVPHLPSDSMLTDEVVQVMSKLELIPPLLVRVTTVLLRVSHVTKLID